MKRSRKSGSGRSSILKVPLKPHSGSNISLNSETPVTSKVKRRVSFAEKSHVKEFICSAEQGTEWENTHSSGLVYHTTTVFNDVSMDDTDVVASVMNKNEKSISKDISQIENDTEFIKKVINSVDKTTLMDTSMEITKGVYSLPHSTKINNDMDIAYALNCGNPTINDKAELHDDSMEFTVPVNNLSRVVHNINRKELPQVAPAINDKTELNDHSLEFTVPVNSLSRVVHNTDRKELPQITSAINDKAELHDDSMEFTVPVNNLSRVVQNIDKEELPQITPAINDKAELHDDSMEFTVPVNNLSRVVHNINRKELLQVAPATNDKTELNDHSLEFTVPVNSLSRVVHNINREELPQVAPTINDKTELNDHSLEFTVPVNNLSRVVHNINRKELPQVAPAINDKTELNDHSLEFTVPVNNLSRVVHNINRKELPQLTPAINDKAELHDDSLEFTVPVNNLSRVGHNIDRKELLQVTEISARTMPNQIRLLSEKEAGVIENVPSKNNSMNISKPVYFNPTSSTITSNTIVNADKFEHTTNENREYSLLQNENNNLGNKVSITNEKLEKDDCLLDSACRITRKDHSMDEDGKQTNIQFNSSNDGMNKSTHQRTNNILSSCTTYYNNDLENMENISANNQSIHALTSLISSFVYADIIEDDSFMKTIDKVQQETQFRENVMDVDSVDDIVNVQTSIESPEICINDERIVQQSENNLDYYSKDNVQVGNVMIKEETNNQHDSDEDAAKIRENVLTIIAINERLSKRNYSIRDLGITQRDKQLDKRNQNTKNDSEICIIKSKENSNLDTSECPNAHSSNNQILCRSRLLSPTYISSFDQYKTCIEKDSINPVAGMTGLTYGMDITYNDNNFLREEVDHIALKENTENNSNFQEDKFSFTVEQIKDHMLSDDCIWDLHYENIDKQMVVVSFISKSLLIIIYTENDVNTNTRMIKNIDVISRLENDENVLLSIAHKLIIEKINIEFIRVVFKYEKDIIFMLDHISKDVKFILDFIFDLKKLEDTNLMEINTESITFISRSKCMEIILKITMDIKLLHQINSSNVKVVSILGGVIENEIKELLTNVKRDHKFLRRYMSDIKDYIDIIEQVNLVNKKCRS